MIPPENRKEMSRTIFIVLSAIFIGTLVLIFAIVIIMELKQRFF